MLQLHGYSQLVKQMLKKMARRYQCAECRNLKISLLIKSSDEALPVLTDLLAELTSLIEKTLLRILEVYLFSSLPGDFSPSVEVSPPVNLFRASWIVPNSGSKISLEI